MMKQILAYTIQAVFVITVILVWRFGNQDVGLAVLAGGAVPMVISGMSILLFKILIKTGNLEHLSTKFLVGNFITKMITIGLWMVIILQTTDLPVPIFILALVGSFIAWHGYEAYHYQVHFLKDAEQHPKNI